jgi:hypothetical protein
MRRNINTHHPATSIPSGLERYHEADTRLHGRWLLLTRMVWFAMVVLTLCVYIASIPDYLSILQTRCRLAVCSYGQLSTDTIVTLQHFGLYVGSYSACIFVLSSLLALVCCGVGGLIFWRKSDDWMALLFALVVVVGGTAPVLLTVGTSHSVWKLPISFVGELLYLLFFLAFALFPNGRFVPHWIRWLLVVLSIETVVITFFMNPLTSPLWIEVPVVLLFCCYLVCLPVSSLLSCTAIVTCPIA